MKRLLSLLIIGIMVISLSACGDNEQGATNNNDVAGSDSVGVQQNDVGNKNEANETTSEESTTDSNNEQAKWKQFLKDYEAWVDDYIEISKKYKDNPTDMTILADYTKMASELSKWTEQIDDIEKELENSEDILEFSTELSRIAGKLAEATK